MIQALPVGCTDDSSSCQLDGTVGTLFCHVLHATTPAEATKKRKTAPTTSLRADPHVKGLHLTLSVLENSCNGLLLTKIVSHRHNTAMIDVLIAYFSHVYRI